jgi:hypothetical protein
MTFTLSYFILTSHHLTLTFRYRKFLRMVDAGVPSPHSLVPDSGETYDRADFLPTCRVAPDRVFLCRRVYESRQRRLLKNPN